MNALVYVDIGIYKVKLKVALNEKRKQLRGFSFSIYMANFEAFCRIKNLSANLFFLKGDLQIHNCVFQIRLGYQLSILTYETDTYFHKNLYNFIDKKIHNFMSCQYITAKLS